jgi:hypothetical protein
VTGSTLTLPLEPMAGSRAGACAEHPKPRRVRDQLDSQATAAGTAFTRITESNNYERWLHHVSPAAACTRPIRLSGQLHTVDEHSGEILASRSTEGLPDGVVYTPCGNRRAVVCPACAQTYRADTYQLIAAGLRGGKGVPETVAQHPCIFATFSALSFGLVHHRVERHGRVLPCRPRRKPDICPHGVNLACNRVHKDGEKSLGTPLCLDCYDHDHQVVWNSQAGELWRRTSQHVRRTLERQAKDHGFCVRVSFAKVAEFQVRGVVHFHALFRLDGLDPDDPEAILPPPPCIGAADLEAAIREAAESISFTTTPHVDKPQGWHMAWGEQLDTRQVRMSDDGEITDTAVAGYVAKYATKSTEATGHTSARLTDATVDDHAHSGSHVGRLIEACWRLGRPGVADPPKKGNEPPYKKLRRWAHMLGFGGHFSTRSQAYSTTLRALREARVTWRREHHRSVDHTDEETTLVVGTLTYAGTGWRTLGDALLASTAAAKAREHREVAREELQALEDMTAA